MLKFDLGHLDLGELLPVPHSAMITFPAAILIGDKLRALELIDDFANHLRPLHIGTDADASAFTDEKNVIEFNLIASGTIELLDREDFTRASAILFTTGFENCVRHSL